MSIQYFAWFDISAFSFKNQDTSFIPSTQYFTK